MSELQQQQNPSDKPIIALDSLKLLPHQNELLSALYKVDSELGNRYSGALFVLNQMNNSDRYAQAAHSIRELMNGLTKYLDIGIQTPHLDVVNKVNGLEGKWETCLTTTNCHNDYKWKGEIDTPLSVFLPKIQRFFDWYKKHFPRSEKKLAEAFHKLDPSGSKLPESIQKMNVEKWINVKGFFINVLHHKTSTTTEEFYQRLNELERTLLDMLKPKTIIDLEEIDKIINEGETVD
jgi:hypothetical protein